MSQERVVLTLKEYPFLAPLERGDISLDGIDLVIDHHDPMNRALNDPSVHGGELSFGVYLIGVAQGDKRFVGLPVFPYRAFRHRCFLTLEGSGILDIDGLAGKRVGTNAWPTTSSTWNRAILRAYDVDITKIKWSVGPMDDPALGTPKGSLPSYANPVSPGRTIEQMLLEGEVDALMCPRPPQSFYQSNSPIVRIVADYRTAEREHFKRTHLFPPDHVFAVRREVLDRIPRIGEQLYLAFEQSKNLWLEHLRTLPYSNITPWALADIEEIVNEIGSDWQPFGTDSNRAMIQALIDESVAQGLIQKPIGVDEVFADFNQSVGS
jgi:4,5-dihydroxyphthalate decarboxylase